MKRSYSSIVGAFRGSPTWTTTILANAAGAQAYTQALAATAPTADNLNFSLVSGSLPSGVTISGSSLTGAPANPTADTTFTFVLRATGTSTAAFAERAFTLLVTKTAATDAFSSSVQYLYHCDQSYSDASAKGRTLAVTNANTLNGSTATNPKFGTGSFAFNGASMPTNFDLRIPASSDMVMTGDFTFEFFMNAASSANGQTQNMVMFVSANGPVGYNGSAEPANVVSIFAQPGNTSGANRITVKFTPTGAAYSGTTVVNDSTWRHIAIVRNGMGTNNVTIYQNGSAEVSFTYTGTADFGSQYGMKIGQWVGQQTNCYYKGYLDEIRLTTAARYSANFTPPTAAFSYP